MDDLPTIQRRDLRTVAGFLHRLTSPGCAIDRDEVVRTLASLWESTGFAPTFDWRSWLRDQSETSADAGLTTDPSALASASLETLRRLATVHLRTNRFVEGHLSGLLASGYLDAFLVRLRVLLDETTDR